MKFFKIALLALAMATFGGNIHAMATVGDSTTINPEIMARLKGVVTVNAGATMLLSYAVGKIEGMQLVTSQQLKIQALIRFILYFAQNKASHVLAQAGHHALVPAASKATLQVILSFLKDTAAKRLAHQRFYIYYPAVYGVSWAGDQVIELIINTLFKAAPQDDPLA